MGGRITRALYKNQRQGSGRRLNKYGQQMRELSITFTLVMSSVASFLIGYLYRPYTYESINKLKSLTINSSRQQSSSSSNDNDIIITCCLSLICLTSILFGYVLRKQSPKESALNIVQRINKILLTISGLIFVIDIISWMISYEIAWMFRIAYALMWIEIVNICLLVFSGAKMVQYKKQCKSSSERSLNQQQKQIDWHNTKRSAFLLLAMTIFETGIKCSQYMRQLRVDKMVKDVIEGKSLHINTISESLSSSSNQPLQHTLSSLPLKYQSYIIESQFYQKLIQRVVFLFLVLMIIVTVIAFEKKSLFHFYFYDLRSKQYHDWYQKQVSRSQDNKEEQNTVGTNLSSKSIIISGVLFFIGVILVQYQVCKISYQKIDGFTLQNNDESFQSTAIFYLATLSASILILRVLSWFKFKIINNSSNSQSTKNNEEKRRKTAQMTSLVAVFVLVVFIHYNINYLINPTQNQPQNQSINPNYLQLSTLLITQAILTFYFIKFTKEQLWRFPQTSLQPYISITVMIVFAVKYVLPEKVLSFIGKNTINYTILPLTKLSKGLLYLFVEKSGESSEKDSEFISSVVLTFGIGLIFIALNHNQSLESAIQKTQQVTKNKEIKKQSGKHYSDEDSVLNLSSNIFSEDNIEEKDEASTLLK